MSRFANFLLCLFVTATFSYAATVTVNGNITSAVDSTNATGTAIVSWTSFVNPSNVRIDKGSVRVPVRASTFTVALEPNISSGTAYSVAYQLTIPAATNFTESWVIPASPSTTTRAAILVLTSPTPLSLYEPSLGSGSTLQFLRGDKTWAVPPGGAAPSGTGLVQVTSGVFGTPLALNTYEPAITAGTSSQYWKGNKTWGTLSTDVLGLLSATSPLVYNSSTGAFTCPTCGSGAVASVFGRTGTVVAATNDYNTSQVNEVTNLYFTNGRAVSALSGLYEVPLTIGAGLNRSVNTITVPASGITNAMLAGSIQASKLVGTDIVIPASQTTGFATVATSGVYADLTSKPTLGSLAALSVLPNPSSSTLGGVESIAAVSHQFITSISTLGVPVLAQPAASDVSGLATVATTGVYSDLTSKPTLGSLAALSVLPNPSSSTLGGIQSITAVTHNFLTSISTSGVPAQAQPAYSDISGTPAVAQINDAASDVGLYFSTNLVEQYNSTSAQTSSLYGTRTDASNYERLTTNYDGTQYTILTTKLGTGSTRSLNIGIGGSNQLRISGNYIGAVTDNTYDLGQSTSSNRFRNAYFGTSVTTPSIDGVSAATMAFVDPTSSIQTQLNGKLATGGTATAATALAANGTNCSAGNYPLGVDASGNAEGCTTVSTYIPGPAFVICITVGCGSEVSDANWAVLAPAGITFDECQANLKTAATGSSVIIDIQTSAGVSIFGGTKLVIPTSTLTAVFQSTFSSSPYTAAKGGLFKVAVTQNDSGVIAQGAYVSCRVH